jgi:hypothetical protein
MPDFIKGMLDFMKKVRRLPSVSQGNTLLFDAGLCEEIIELSPALLMKTEHLALAEVGR